VLFTQATLESIRTGAVTVAFRRWRTLRVREGSTVRTAIGLVVITSVAALDLEDVSIRDAHQAGFRTVHALLDELARHPDGQLYRIGLRYAGADPRIALRERDDVTGSERDELVARVSRLGV
jgi:hypothetical protein